MTRSTLFTCHTSRLHVTWNVLLFYVAYSYGLDRMARFLDPLRVQYSTWIEGLKSKSIYVSRPFVWLSLKVRINLSSALPSCRYTATFVPRGV